MGTKIPEEDRPAKPKNDTLNRVRRELEEAREREARLRSILDRSLDAAYRRDLAAGNYDYIGPAIQEITGFPPNEFCALTLAEAFARIHPDDLQTVQQQVKQARSGARTAVEYRFKRKDGEFRWLSDCFTIIDGPNGQPQYLLGGVRDITERKRTEEALVRAKEEWERTFDSVPDMIAIIDSQYHILRANEAMAQRLGLEPEQCIGLRCYEAMHGLSRPPEFCPHVKTLKDGLQHSEEVHEERLGGDFLVSTTPLADEDGQTVGAVHVARDITERKKAEEALRKSESNLTAAQRIAHIGSWEWDTVEDTAHWSPETFRIFGVVPGTLEGHRQNFLDMIHREDRARVDQALSDAVNGIKEYDLEYRIVLPDKTEKTIHALAEVIRTEDGRPILMRGTVQDITERKRMEVALKTSEERSRLAFKAAHSGSFDWDAKTDTNLWSDELLGLYGMRKEEFGRRYEDWVECLVPEDREAGTAAVNHSLETGDFSEVFRIRRRDTGEVRWIDGRAQVFFDADGKPNRMVGINVDITDHKRAEEALRRSEARLRRFFDSGIVGVVCWTIDGKITDANDKFLEMVDYTRDDLNAGSINWGEMTPAEYRHLDEYALGELKSTGVDTPYEKEYVRKDGGRVPIIIGAAMLDEPPGEGIAFVLDISERKRAEEELRESRAKLDAALSSMTDAVFVSDADGNFIDFNDAFATFYKFRGKEECRKTFAEYPAILDVFLPDGTPAPLDMWVVPRSLRGEAATAAEYTLRRKDTGETWVGSYSFGPIRDEGGAIVGSVVVARDITERKEVERKLQESEGMLARAQQMAHVGHWERDMSSTKIRWSDEIYRIFGLEPQECEVDPSSFFEFIHPEDRASLEKEIGDAIEGVRPHNQVFRIVRPDGSIRWAHGKGEVTRTSDGRPVRIFGTILDITERKQMEDELRRSRDELELRVRERTTELREAHERLVTETKERENLEEHLRQAQKMEAVGTLAGGIAHDFNNMLAIIIGNAELAHEDMEGNEGPSGNIEQILKASKRARDLVKQILTFSRRTETGRNPLKLTPLVKETFKLLRGTLPSTIRMNLKVQTKMDTIIADPSQIQQVLMNLATNAAHAMREGGGVFTVGISDVAVRDDSLPDAEMQPRTYVKLTVRDTGTGIEKEVLPRIFEPFFTTKEVGKGTGMGLAVVYGIVKSHGGAITVDSKPGKGSTFNVFLPSAEGQAKEQQEEEADVPYGKERILLVDDEPELVAVVTNTLERLGYHVTSALNGSEAWDMFRKDNYAYDLVITDQIMPDLTGIDLAKRMLEMRKDLPIILFTGYSEAVSPEKAKQAGISEFLMKPVVKKELAEIVRRVLEGEA